MKGQQIGPWTFLKDNAQSYRQRQSKQSPKKVEVHLPKLIKKRQTVKRQDYQCNLSNFRNKVYSKHSNTMVLTQMKYLQSQQSATIKKKTQPISYELTKTEQEIFDKEDELSNLIDMRTILKFIHAQLESQKYSQKGNLSQHLDQIRKKMVSIPQTFQILNNLVTCRIHDNNIQSKVWMIRSILKKQSQKSHQIKRKRPKNKNSNHILALKLKSTQEEHKVH